jgi:hypothetical protein
VLKIDELLLDSHVEVARNLKQFCSNSPKQSDVGDKGSSSGGKEVMSEWKPRIANGFYRHVFEL